MRRRARKTGAWLRYQEEWASVNVKIGGSGGGGAAHRRALACTHKTASAGSEARARERATANSKSKQKAANWPLHKHLLSGSALRIALSARRNRLSAKAVNEAAAAYGGVA